MPPRQPNPYATTPSEPTPAPQLPALTVGAILLITSAYLFLTPHAWTTLYERDLPAYVGAINAFAAGHDPYTAAQVRHAHGLPFIAPPFVWLLYKAAAHSPLKAVFGGVLMAADLISIVLIPATLSRLLLGPGLGRTVLGAGVYFAAFLGAGVFTGLVVNNGTPLYALIALGLIPAVTKDRWLAFHLAVALATAFKPFYAAFWLVPLLADAQARRQWVTAALAMAAAAAAYLVPMLLMPKLMAEWVHTLVQQVVSDDRLGDNLLGAMSLGPVSGHASGQPYLAQIAFSAVLVAASLLLGRLDRRVRIAGLILAAVFLDPRAMRYDLSTAAIPLLALIAGARSRWPAGALAQAVWAAILAAATIALSHDTPADGFVYAAIAVAAMVWAVIASRLRPVVDD